MKGVISRPLTPLASASCNAVFIAVSIFAPAAASSEGMGTPSRMPEERPSEDEALINSAASPGESSLWGALNPLSAV